MSKIRKNIEKIKSKYNLESRNEKLNCAKNITQFVDRIKNKLNEIEKLSLNSIGIESKESIQIIERELEKERIACVSNPYFFLKRKESEKKI